MKTTKQDFELFKKECKLWLIRFELSHWDIVYEHRAGHGNYANLSRDITSFTGIIGLTQDLDIEDFDIGVSRTDYIKGLAKHEVIHVLLARLVEYGTSKEFTSADCYRAEEELVRKLECIIK